MSDLISRKAVIQDIEDLLESPYAHSQFGEVSKEVGFIVRKDIAGTIIDLCIKRAENAYDVDKVVEKLELTIDNVINHERAEIPEEEVYSLLLYFVQLVKRGGKDE